MAKNEPPKTDRCHYCQAVVPGARFICRDCERRQAYGIVIERARGWWGDSPDFGLSIDHVRAWWDFLDTVTWLWTLRKREIIQRRRQALEDARDAQRAARDAFYEGRIWPRDDQW